MRDKSHRSIVQKQETPQSEKQKVKTEKKIKYDQNLKNSIMKMFKDSRYCSMMISYSYRYSDEIVIEDVKATILKDDYDAFIKEIKACNFDKTSTLSVINKYSPVNRENRSTGSTNIGWVTPIERLGPSSGLIKIGKSSRNQDDDAFNKFF